MRPPSASRVRRALGPVAVATVVATYAVIVLGSTVRVTESGMGCPDWPLCHGRIGPVDHFHALLEQGHRYLVLAVTVGVVATAVLAWRARAGHRVVYPALVGVALLMLQIALGAVTVFTRNAPPTVAMHLAGAFLLLAAVTVTAVTATAPPGAGAPPDRLARWALGATFALLVSGSLVVDGGASTTCPSWPWCRSRVGVAASLVALQLAHRALAAAAGVLLVALALRAIVHRREAPAGRPFAWALAGLLPAQFGVGAATALLGAPPAAQDVHLALAAAIWVSATALIAGTSMPPVDRVSRAVLAPVHVWAGDASEPG